MLSHQSSTAAKTVPRMYSPEVPELSLILFSTNLELPMISQTSSSPTARRNPYTQLSMSSVPQSRWKTSPRTRRHRLYGSNMCWEALGPYHSLTAKGHHVPLCQAIL